MKKLASFIIETRYFEDFGDICHEHLKKLPKDKDLFIYTSEENKEKYKKQLNKLKIKHTFKDYNQNTEVPLDIRYINGMNQLLEDSKIKALLNMCIVMTNPDFWKDYFNYERVLIFQRDSRILREGIEEFMIYDYIGAPCYNFVKDKTIQNGGFSLRNPRTMEYICRMYGLKLDLMDLMVVGQYSSASFFAEDIFFCLRMIKYDVGLLAPIEISKKFSAECKFELETFGYHAIERYLSEDEQHKIKTQYL